MIDLNPDRAAVARALQRIENKLYANGKKELLPYGVVDIQQATNNVLELLAKVRAEHTDRDQLLRLREVYQSAQTEKNRTFFFPEDDKRDRTYSLDLRYKYLTSTYLYNLVPLTELYPRGTTILFDTLEELKRFKPEVYNNAEIKEWTYENWDLGREFIKPDDRRFGQAWGVKYSVNDDDDEQQCGKRYSVDYIPKSVADEIAGKQKEIGEKYVAGNLMPYRGYLDRVAKQPTYTVPSFDDLRSSYLKAAKDRNYAPADLPVFTNAGKQKAVAIGAKYTDSPRKWPNEWLDWYTWIGTQEYLQFYHYVTPSMIDARNFTFIQGDAEAFFRFCKELEQVATISDRAPTKSQRRPTIKEQLLKELLQREPNPETNRKVGELVPMTTGNKGKRPADDVSKRRNDYLGGAKTFSSRAIDRIINELEQKRKTVKDVHLLERVKHHAT